MPVRITLNFCLRLDWPAFFLIRRRSNHGSQANILCSNNSALVFFAASAADIHRLYLIPNPCFSPFGASTVFPTLPQALSWYLQDISSDARLGMGDAYPGEQRPTTLRAEELSDWAELLRQSGSSSDPQELTWPVPQPSSASTTWTMGELEPPTRPVTPECDSGVDDARSRTETPATPVAPCAPTQQDRRTISAAEPRCAVCYKSFKGRRYECRAEHFNTCWDKLRKAAVESTSSSRRLVSSDSPSSKAPCPTNTDTSTEACVFCDLPLGTLSCTATFEHRVLCQRNLPTPPTTCPRCKTRFSDESLPWNCCEIAEHIYTCTASTSQPPFSAARTHWQETTSARADPRNCAHCALPLEHFTSLDAFHHRRLCLEKSAPAHCPVCFGPFPTVSERCTWVDLHWHVHGCQHGGALSAIDKDDFESLEARCQGRSRGVWKVFGRNEGFFLGVRRGWTHREHRDSFREKTKDSVAGAYTTRPSRLRSFAVLDRGAVRVVQRVRSGRRVWASLGRFLCSQFAVYSVPAHGRGGMVSRMGMEYTIDDIVRD
ncbi:uncharacterized protein EKO05_0008954 [Ascochyta rabiei]|uniref:uncharacterized protein n=1 Tax=Didymella rabiei TaxID=5454 RepID=UPI00220689C2|nr:uncharacterized protein EKO05_0008954 [Ascochyta rabiei]UPX18662.1 hypothetical protein EKO05_0008954 [Ascochyta rabiei]